MRNFRKSNINTIKKTAKLLYCLAVSFCVFSFISEACCALALSGAAINSVSDYRTFFASSDLQASLPGVSTDAHYYLRIDSSAFSSPIALNLKYDSKKSRLYGGLSSANKSDENSVLYAYVDKSELGFCSGSAKGSYYTLPLESLGSSLLFSNAKINQSIFDYSSAFKQTAAFVISAKSLLQESKISELLENVVMQAYHFSKNNNEYSFKIRSEDVKTQIADYASGKAAKEKLIWDFAANSIKDGDFVFYVKTAGKRIDGVEVVTPLIQKSSYRIKISLNPSAKTIETEFVNNTKKLHKAAFRVSRQKGGSVSFPEPSNSKPASQMSIGELSAMGEAFSEIKKCVQ